MDDFFIGKTCRYVLFHTYQAFTLIWNQEKFFFIWSRYKCTSFFGFHCHIQYICMSWTLMFGLLLAIFRTSIFQLIIYEIHTNVYSSCFNWIYVAAIMLLWVLHQKGFFDPLYDWWDDIFSFGSRKSRTYSKPGNEFRQSLTHVKYDEHLAC